MTLIRIEGDTLPFVFEGQELAAVTTDTPRSPRARWLRMGVYLKDDGSFVFHKASESRVWHLPTGAGHVRKPGQAVREELPADAVYCGVLPPPRHDHGQCPPLDGRRPPSRAPVITELPQHTIWTCPDRDTLIRQVVLATRRGSGVTSAAISEPARELLAQLARRDPEFAGRAVQV